MQISLKFNFPALMLQIRCYLERPVDSVPGDLAFIAYTEKYFAK
jgi:hypothetical protein